MLISYLVICKKNLISLIQQWFQLWSVSGHWTICRCAQVSMQWSWYFQMLIAFICSQLDLFAVFVVYGSCLHDVFCVYLLILWDGMLLFQWESEKYCCLALQLVFLPIFFWRCSFIFKNGWVGAKSNWQGPSTGEDYKMLSWLESTFKQNRFSQCRIVALSFCSFIFGVRWGMFEW